MPRGMGHGKHMNEKAKDFKGTIQKLFVYLKPYYAQFAIVMLFAGGSTVFSIFGPKILAKATDQLSEGIVAKVSHTGGIDFHSIAEILIFLVGYQNQKVKRWYQTYLLDYMWNLMENYILQRLLLHLKL